MCAWVQALNFSSPACISAVKGPFSIHTALVKVYLNLYGDLWLEGDAVRRETVEGRQSFRAVDPHGWGNYNNVCSGTPKYNSSHHNYLWQRLYFKNRAETYVYTAQKSQPEDLYWALKGKFFKVATLFPDETLSCFLWVLRRDLESLDMIIVLCRFIVSLVTTILNLYCADLDLLLCVHCVSCLD